LLIATYKNGPEARATQAALHHSVNVCEVAVATPDIVYFKAPAPIERSVFVALSEPDNAPHNRWLVRLNPISDSVNDVKLCRFSV